ncbi:imidazole glycerol phosphate synthase subunit HisF [Megasphaera paucivorans]|uniref:Imidazole glycerol phosphate synthase subunit HisF n=1 Tax=Megasphaera paucivorans TaxID=349095 RepID=A0A1G9W927_9FIRM|nr:imidazole glycerol phosphate synthase subunit HisF [Megasphaera paucivorans]SDM81032.1 cyclase [Megasphaera paucivorans]
MLAKRIVPCLDVCNGRVVKGKQFKHIQDVDDPVKLGKFYSDQMADELVFYDITATHEQRGIFIDVVKAVAEEINIPFTIGGGIRTIEDFRQVLLAGADKVSVNSAAVLRPELIREAAARFGNQCVVLSIDAKRNNRGSWDVYVEGGRKNTEIDAIAWAKQGVALGAGEICINSIDADGEKKGFDLELNRRLAIELPVPIIASGGAGTMKDFKDVFDVGVDAALAASVFHFGQIDIPDLKMYLQEKGIPMREVEA